MEFEDCITEPVILATVIPELQKRGYTFERVIVDGEERVTMTRPDGTVALVAERPYHRT